MKPLPEFRACALAVLLGSLALPVSAIAADWPAWRGPAGQGISAETAVPTRWSRSENVRWKVPLPGPGNSTPAVRAGRIYLTQAADGGKERSLICLDRKDGRVLWKQSVRHEEPEPTHGDNPYCSASPAVAGDRVIAFHGSAGIFCHDHEGKEIWRAPVGKLQHIWGNASSPVIHGDLVFFNCGPGPRTFLQALDLRSGKEVWKVEVPGGLEDGGSEKWTGSWSTPLLVRAGDREDLVIGFPHRLSGFDPRTGKERWWSEGPGRLVYASPVSDRGVIVALSGFMGPSTAVRAGGEGDVTSTHRLWRRERAPQEIGSGVMTGGHFYIVHESGAGECIEAETGKTVWRERVCGKTWSSLVLAGENLYALDESGTCAVLRAAPKLELISQNELGEMTRASPAISDGEIFIRTYQHLWCLAGAK